MAAAPPPGRSGAQDGTSELLKPPGGPTAAAAAAAGAAFGAAPPQAFRYWVDELLWSQGRLATITIEEVLDQAGGQRTGGPHKPAAAAFLPGGGSSSSSKLPPAEQPTGLQLQQLLQAAQLSEQQQQAAAASPTVTAGVDGPKQQPLSRRRSSSEPSPQPLSRNSSAGSRDSDEQQRAARQPLAAAAPQQQQQPSAVAAATAAAAAAAAAGGCGSSSEEALDSSAAAAGSAAGALGPTKRPDDALLGYHHVKHWDLLWTKSVFAIRAARQLQHGQLVSAIAGLNCLSMKKRMVQTLRMALGARQAFTIVPLSFCIPEDLRAWQAWLASPQGAAADTGLWMLKTGQDAGKGLRLVHTQHALQVASRPPKNPAKPQTQLKVAQAYITNPLLIAGRKFHLRLWLLVTSAAPLRAYLHSEGLVLFSSEPYDAGRPLDGGVRPSASHVTNYARNEDTWVWGLPALADALGPAVWARLWAKMRSASALTAASVLGPLRAANRWLQPSIPSYGFQMLGLDFLVDETMHPWLLEVNSAPSIMAVHSEPGTCGLIKSTKQAMLGDMLAMVQHRLGGGGGDCGSSRPLSWREELASEMANRGGFEPLMQLLPVPSSSSSGGGGGGSSSSRSGGAAGCAGSIPWQEVDVQLQQVLQQQYAGQ